MFYYLYDGLESANRLTEFFLDPVLRLHHRYLGEDAQDAETKKVRGDQQTDLVTTINVDILDPVK